MNAQAPENSVPVISSPEAVFPFQLYETRPDSITWHMIWDHELDELVNISRPVTLGLATMLVGAFLGLMPSVLTAVSLVQASKPMTVAELLLAMTAALCLAGGAACGFFAYRGQVDALAVRNTVRCRNIRAVTPPSQTSGQAA